MFGLSSSTAAVHVAAVNFFKIRSSSKGEKTIPKKEEKKVAGSRVRGKKTPCRKMMQDLRSGEKRRPVEGASLSKCHNIFYN